MENAIIKFKNNELITITDDNEKILVAIRPISDAIGLNPVSVIRELKKHEILGPEHTV